MLKYALYTPCFLDCINSTRDIILNLRNFHPPQVKWYFISGVRKVVHELPHVMENGISLGILGKWKYQKNLETGCR